MRWFAPSYYPAFSCSAGDCRHNCCIGWEIDIDEETLEFYHSIDGELGQRLKQCIVTEGIPHFVLTAEQRCPFLNQENLCELISTLGADALCQICSDHPRFRNDWSDRTELGLGLCCETAGHLILGATEPVSLLPVWEGPEHPISLSAMEKNLRQLRDDVISILQDRSIPIPERVQLMLTYCGTGLPDNSRTWWAEQFLSLERLDDAWTEHLTALKIWNGTLPDKLPLPDTVWEQLLIYFVYRHFSAALEDGDIAGKAAFTALSWQILRDLCALEFLESGHCTLEDLVEICRLYSSEIEYSDVNLDHLFSILS